MPNTGIQANIARRLQEETELADDPWVLNQVIGAINGNFGLPFKLIGFSSDTIYALEINNHGSGVGPQLRAYDNNGVVLLDVIKAGTLIRPELSVRTAANDVLLDVAAARVFIAPALIVHTSGGVALIDLADGTVKLAAGAGVDENVQIGQTTGNVEIGNVDADNTDIDLGGTGSYVQLNANNMDINTAGYLHVNGVSVPSSKTGTYTGNGGVTQRQITTGFQCKGLILERVSNGSQWFCQNTSNSTFVGTGPTIQQQSAVHLHSSDGFWVADGSVNGNTNAETFNYTVFR